MAAPRSGSTPCVRRKTVAAAASPYETDITLVPTERIEAETELSGLGDCSRTDVVLRCQKIEASQLYFWFRWRVEVLEVRRSLEEVRATAPTLKSILSQACPKVLSVGHIGLAYSENRKRKPDLGHH
jgi:hypothetical protein